MAFNVDPAKCSGIGLCELTASAVFEIGDDGQAHVLDAEPSDADREAAKEAISNCPTGALSFDD